MCEECVLMWTELYEERLAIIEYNSNLTKWESDVIAEECIINQYNKENYYGDIK